MAALVLEYYVLLRSVLRTKPHVRSCLTRCRHCRIFFLAHPRNAGRKDLGCPFGCKEAHRKQQSTLRSVAFYQGEHGRILKGYQNEKRRGRAGARSRAVAQPDQDSAGASAPAQGSGHSGASSSEFETPFCPPDLAQALPKAGDPALVEYVRVVVSLIEGRSVSRPEIIEMLQRILRQHSLGKRRTIDHTMAWLHENPP